MWPFVVSRPAAATCCSYSDTKAKYCDESVCVCLCVCVCVCLRSYLRTTCPIFTKFLGILPMTVSRFFCGGIVIHYVLPVLCRPS